MQKKRINLSNFQEVAVIILLLACLCSCGVAKKGNVKGDTNNSTNKKDTLKEFVPLHPPVVVPHSWREAK
ncbi:MAG: hypothetical protein IJN06_05070 [Bacteroidales bacterium]|nr:hypothetical protein [Bacteroidales bacterium]MBQ7018360.1 hypothetical protein [Bacteroidales bacterium]